MFFLKIVTYTTYLDYCFHIYFVEMFYFCLYKEYYLMYVIIYPISNHSLCVVFNALLQIILPVEKNS